MDISSNCNSNESIHDLFRTQSKLTPNKIAVVHNEKKLTFQELDYKSDILAKFLLLNGVNPGNNVGIFLERSLNMVISLMAVLKAGCTYVPLDPNFPAERIIHMIQDSSPNLIISQPDLQSTFALWPDVLQDILLIQDDWSSIENQTTELHLPMVQSDNLAYIIYTSGSTGLPKGVMISHRSLTNVLLYMKDKLSITTDDRLLAVTTFSFDISYLELYLPLITGSTCYICEHDKVLDANALISEISTIRPTIMQATPTTWSMLYDFGWKNAEQMRILCGGELMPKSLKTKFTATTKEVWNVYGPTESTIWSMINRITTDCSEKNIGHPISNTRIYLLDQNNAPVTKGEIGEIAIAGAGLAKGYLNQEEQTRQKFIYSEQINEERLYKTGDLGRWSEDENGFEFLGRTDHQVKVRGYRIELAEIENSMNQHPEIKQAIVCVNESDGYKSLTAFYISKSNQMISHKAFRRYLKQKLPKYMIPDKFVLMQKLPLTPNLKIDRKKLITSHTASSVDKNNNSELDPLLVQVTSTWNKVLNYNVDDNDISFFEAGGNSVLANQLVREIREHVEPKFTTSAVFKHNTINLMYQHLLEMRTSKSKIAGSGNDKSFKKDIDTSLHDIAVVGMSGKFPGGDDLDAFWKNILSGKNCMQMVPEDRWQAKDNITSHSDYNPINVGGFIDGVGEFDPLFFDISPHEAELMDPQQRLLLTHTWLALENANIPKTDFALSKTGVFIAAAANHHYDSLIKESETNNPYIYTSIIPSIISNRISHFFNLSGPSECMEATCSSSFVALHRAIASIRNGECEQAVVGAVNLILSPRNSRAYQAMGLLSESVDLYPFQENAAGYLRSEGVAVLIIKPLAKARHNHDKVLAVIKGTGVNHGGKGSSLTAPNQTGIETAMKQAYRDANVTSDTVSYIEAHGTASLLGDSIEMSGLQAGYQSMKEDKDTNNSSSSGCLISSLKPNIGHCEIASGMAALIKVIYSLSNKTIPGITGFGELSQEISVTECPFRFSSSPEAWSNRADNGFNLPLRASINSYGFGTCAHVVVEEARQSMNPVGLEQQGNHKDLVLVSARSQQQLKDLVESYAIFLQKNPEISFRNLAYTTRVGREAFNERVAFVANNITELLSAMHLYLADNEYRIKLIANDNGLSIEMALEEDDYDQIAILWMQGHDIPMNGKFNDEGKEKILLPNYPFSKKKYWVNQTTKKPKSTNHQKKRICIVGAGPSGLVMAKSLLEEGHTPIIYESQSSMGGIWNLKKDKTFGVYKKTRFQNSADTSFFSDFYPTNLNSLFASVTEVRDYLQKYSEEFGLEQYINYKTTVKSVEKQNDYWKVTIANDNGEESDIYDGVALCHGRYSSPFIPQIDGLSKFEGKIYHSGQYYDNEIFKDKNVLIVGNGVSGMDIAEDATNNANNVYWSMRSLKLILPRMVGFVPNDLVSPASLLIAGDNFGVLERLEYSAPQYYEIYKQSGLLPTRDEFERYPFIHINDNIVKLVADGMVHVIRSEFKSIKGNKSILFDNGESIEDIDVIVFCTGYDNARNFSYVKNIDIYNDFAMGLFYKSNPTMVNAYGINDVGTTGTLPYLEMVARWYAQIISGSYQLTSQELTTTVNHKDIIVAPLASLVIGLKLGCLPDPKISFKSFWKLINYPSYPAVYRLHGPHSKSKKAQQFIEFCLNRSFIPNENADSTLAEGKYKILAGLGKSSLDNLLERHEITKQEYEQALAQNNQSLFIDWNSQYLRPKNKVRGTQNNYQAYDREKKYKELQTKLAVILSDVIKLNPDEIDFSKNLSTYGVSSVTLTTFANKIMSFFNLVKLEPLAFIEHPSLDALATYIFKKFYDNQINDENFSDNEDMSKATNIKDIELPHQTRVIKTDTNHLDTDIAIIGMGGKFPDANSLTDFWEKLKHDHSFVEEIPKNRWHWQDYYGDPENINKTDCIYGSFIKNIEMFDAKHFNLSNDDVMLMDPQHRFVLEATWETLENAGYSKDSLFGQNVGFFFGIERQDYLDKLKRAEIALGASFNTGNAHSMLVNYISHFFGWTGPNAAVNAACCSSFVALQQAVNSLHCNQTDLALAGGVHLLLSPDIYISNRKLNLFTKEEDIRPFDRSANGHYFGEALGIVALKKLNKAIKDSDTIYGVIKGISVKHGGQSVYLAAPNPESHQNVIEDAISKADIDCSDIDYIEAQGAANQLSDTVELKTYHKLFARKDNPVRISTLKGQVGHLAGASGIISLIKTIMSMRNNYLIKVANLNELNWPSDEDEFACDIIDKTRIWPRIEGEHGSILPRRAGVHNFGFGGVVGHTIIEEYIEPRKNQSVSASINEQLIVFSASTFQALLNTAEAFISYITNKDYRLYGFEELLLKDIAHTLQTGRQHFQHRLMVIASTLDEAMNNLKTFTAGNKNGSFIYADSSNFKKSFSELFSDKDIISLVIKWRDENRLEKIAQLWVNGIDIDWHQINNNQSFRKVPLPTYTFDKQKYWPFDKKNNNHIEIDCANVINHRNTKGSYNDAPHTLLSKISNETDIEEIIDNVNKYLVTILNVIGIGTDATNNSQSTLIELGLDSITWMALREKIQQAFNFNFSATALLENKTLNDMSTSIANHVKQNGILEVNDSVSKVINTDNSARFDNFNLLPIQQAFLVGKELDKRYSIGAQIYTEFKIKDLDIAKFTATWQKLIKIHDMLRAVVSSNGLQIVKQVTEDYHMKINDISVLSDEEKEYQIAHIRANVTYKTYSDDAWPLFHIESTKYTDDTYVIHFNISELIADGHSLLLLLSQWYNLYHNIESNVLFISNYFRDFAIFRARQRKSEEYKRVFHSLKNSYDNMPLGPMLPSAKINEQTNIDKPYKRTRIVKQISQDHWQQLKSYANRANVTETALILTVFSDTIAHFINNHNFSLIITTSNRPSGSESFNYVVGPFLSTLPFYVNSNNDYTFKERLQHNQVKLLNGYANNIVDGAEILRELYRTNHFSKDQYITIVFTSLLWNTQHLNELLSPWSQSITSCESRLLTPQIYFEHQCAEFNNTLYLIFDICEAYYDIASIEQLIENYISNLLKSATRHNSQFDDNIQNSTKTLVSAYQYKPLSLTDMQNAYLYARFLNTEQNTISGQIYYEIMFKNISIEILSDAINKVISRHDMLRATISKDGVQTIIDLPYSYQVKVYDLNDSKQNDKESFIIANRYRLLKYVAPLGNSPMFDLCVSMLDHGDLVLHASFDFLIADVTSIQIFFKDLKYYLNNLQNKLEPLRLSYQDYITEFMNQATNQSEQTDIIYWQDRFTKISDGPKFIHLNSHFDPSRLLRSRMTHTYHNYHTFRKYANKLGVSTSILILAIYAQTIADYCHQEPFTIVTVNWDRPPIHTDVNKIIGDFTRLSWQEINPNLKLPFDDQVKLIYQQWQADKEHAATSGLRQLRKATNRDGRSLTFPFVFTNFTPDIGFNINEELDIRYCVSQTANVYMDLVIELKNDRLLAHFDVMERLFENGILSKFMQRFTELMNQIEQAYYNEKLEVLADNISNL